MMMIMDGDDENAYQDEYNAFRYVDVENAYEDDGNAEDDDNDAYNNVLHMMLLTQIIKAQDDDKAWDDDNVQQMTIS